MPRFATSFGTPKPSPLTPTVSARMSKSALALSFGLLVITLLLCVSGCAPTGPASSADSVLACDPCKGWFPAPPVDPDTLPDAWNASVDAQRQYGENHLCSGSEANP